MLKNIASAIFSKNGNLVNKSFIAALNTALKPGGKDPIPQNMDSPVWSCNEWDPLEEIIVGRPDNAVIAPMCAESKACLEPFKYEFYEKNGGKYWRDVVGEEKWNKMIAQNENYVKVLESHGVTVRRPDENHNFAFKYTTPTFGPFIGHDCAMPRDHLFIVGDEIIESSMGWRYRYFEWIPFRTVLMDYWRRGAQLTQAPRPTLEPGLLDETYSDSMTIDEKYDCVDRWVTTEKEPVFDGADFIRLGRDLVAQRSMATNYAGIFWVKKHVADRGVNVHRLPVDISMNLHADVLLQVIKPGVMMYNSELEFKDLSIFTNAGWKMVPAPKPNSDSSDPVWKMTAAFPWLSMNTVYLDPEHVFVDKSEPEMIRFYEKHGVTPIPIDYKDTRWLGGGLHCWTCDIRRRGPMQSYI